MRGNIDAAEVFNEAFCILQTVRRSVARSQALLSCRMVAIARLAMCGVAAVACRWT